MGPALRGNREFPLSQARRADPMEMQVPRPRGVLSGAVVALFGGDEPDQALFAATVRDVDDIVTDEDAQLALWMLYELHYRGFRGTGHMEWDPLALRMRAALEQPFEAELRGRTRTLVEDARASAPDLVDQMIFA